MSFWQSEMGEITGNAEDAFAKTFRQIPDGTTALAKIERFENAHHKDSGNKYLNIDWVLTEGEFKGQKVSQKIKVFDRDAKVKHRALNMLKLIFQLFKVQPKHNNPPTDQDLAIFIGKIAGIKIRETEPNEEGRQYNWVSEVHNAQGFKCETGVKLIVTHHVSQQRDELMDNAFARNPKYSGDNFADDIPF